MFGRKTGTHEYKRAVLNPLKISLSLKSSIKWWMYLPICVIGHRMIDDVDAPQSCVSIGLVVPMTQLLMPYAHPSPFLLTFVFNWTPVNCKYIYTHNVILFKYTYYSLHLYIFILRFIRAADNWKHLVGINDFKLTTHSHNKSITFPKPPTYTDLTKTKRLHAYHAKSRK